MTRSPLPLALALSLAAACAPAPDRAASDTPATTGPATRGEPAPPLTLRDRQGALVELASLRGRVVVVDFWASWCAPCREALPRLEGLSQALAERGVVVIGVNVDSDRADAERMLAELPVSFPVVFDEGRGVADRWAPPKMPSTFVIDQAGAVVYVQAGYAPGDEAALEARIRELLP